MTLSDMATAVLGAETDLPRWLRQVFRDWKDVDIRWRKKHNGAEDATDIPATKAQLKDIVQAIAGFADAVPTQIWIFNND